LPQEPWQKADPGRLRELVLGCSLLLVEEAMANVDVAAVRAPHGEACLFHDFLEAARGWVEAVRATRDEDRQVARASSAVLLTRVRPSYDALAGAFAVLAVTIRQPMHHAIPNLMFTIDTADRLLHALANGGR
jgi:hypothetical protein